MAMRRTVSILVFVLFSGVLPVAPPSTDAQTLALYDDFSAPGIDGNRWRLYDHVTRYARTAPLDGGWAQGAEDLAMSRPDRSIVNAHVDASVTGGRLRLALTTHGAREVSGLAQGRGHLGASASISGVERMRAKVTVSATTVEPCGEHGSRSRAQILAHFFSEAERDVFASLSLERETSAGNRIVAVVSRCRNSRCTVVDDLGFVVFTRSWSVGATHVLTIRHDRERNRFVFTVAGDGVPAETRAIAHPVPASFEPPVLGIRDLRVENSPAACASTDGDVPRPEVTMDALFDNVAFAQRTAD